MPIEMLTKMRKLSAILGFSPPTLLAPSAVIFVMLQACSMDIVPVAPDRVKMVKLAEQPILRGPQAPGAFKYTWDFQSPKGYLFDSTELEIQNGVIRAKTEKTVMLVTHLSAPYVALDSFQEAPGSANQGKFAYQFSPNNSAWYFHNGAKWVLAGPTASQANSAEDVSKNIGRFHLEVGMGSLSVRVFLISKSEKERAELQSFTAQGIRPGQDGSD